MPMQKKVTRKDDGRYLIYYHFAETASPEETAAFEAVQGGPDELPDALPAVPQDPAKEAPHV
jgi:hypothetical protein